MTEIVFIGAIGRSGTTLLERALATADGNIALGEVVYLWQRGVGLDESCGCGATFSTCEFWTAVGDRAFGGWNAEILASVETDRLKVDRNRYIPFMLAPRFAPKAFRAARSRYLDVLDTLYTAIADTAAEQHQHVDVLLDSSKHPSHLLLLRSLPNHRVRLLHVVRDPRGVVHSCARLVERPETGRMMKRTGAARVLARWTTHNLMFQVAGWLGIPHKRLAYESFSRDPLALERTFDELMQRPPGSPIALDGSEIVLGRDHTVSGNPVRFATGRLAIRADEKWRREMSPLRRSVIGVLTTPLRQIYAR